LIGLVISLLEITMVVLAPGGPPMSRRIYLSHLDMPKGDFRYWQLADMTGRADDVRFQG
jgi:hypothetical protein